MAAQGNITLNTKVYVPNGRQPDNSMAWRLIGDSSFGGATSTLTDRVSGPSKDGIYRVRLKLDVPKAAATDSPCSCTGQAIGQGIFNCEVVIPSTFTAAERQDFVDRIQGAIANALFEANVASLEPAW